MIGTRLTPAAALAALPRAGGTFTRVLGHGSLQVEIYRPERVDPQRPHDRDEVYVAI